jgi:hypothetical protein
VPDGNSLKLELSIKSPGCRAIALDVLGNSAALSLTDKLCREKPDFWLFFVVEEGRGCGVSFGDVELLQCCSKVVYLM